MKLTARQTASFIRNSRGNYGAAQGRIVSNLAEALSDLKLPDASRRQAQTRVRYWKACLVWLDRQNRPTGPLQFMDWDSVGNGP